MSMAWLDGAFLPLAEARVSVLDRGFLLGDGVYEIVPVYSRRPFRLSAHLERLQYSLDGIRLTNPHPPEIWAKLVNELIARQDFDDQSLMIEITRGGPGAGDPLRDQAFPRAVRPTVLLFAQPLVLAGAAQKAAGVCAITATDPRWAHCDIKAVSLLANALMRQRAVEAGCAETILLCDGQLAEGAASNIFVVIDGVLRTPAPSPRVLSGITRDVVLELAAAHGLAHRVGTVSKSELRCADEIWMTSSTREIMPVVQLDGARVGAGVPGPMARRMDALYQQFKQEVMRA